MFLLTYSIEYKTFNIIKEFYILDLQKVLETENMTQEDIINSIIIGPRSSQNSKKIWKTTADILDCINWLKI